MPSTAAEQRGRAPSSAPRRSNLLCWVVLTIVGGKFLLLLAAGLMARLAA